MTTKIFFDENSDTIALRTMSYDVTLDLVSNILYCSGGDRIDELKGYVLEFPIDIFCYYPHKIMITAIRYLIDKGLPLEETYIAEAMFRIKTTSAAIESNNNEKVTKRSIYKEVAEALAYPPSAFIKERLDLLLHHYNLKMLEIKLTTAISKMSLGEISLDKFQVEARELLEKYAVDNTAKPKTFTEWGNFYKNKSHSLR